MSTINVNNAFALTAKGVIQNQNRTTKFGASLVPLNLLSGSRPDPIQAPLSNKAKKRKIELDQSRNAIKNSTSQYTHYISLSVMDKNHKMASQRDNLKKIILDHMKQTNQENIKTIFNTNIHLTLIKLIIREEDNSNDLQLVNEIMTNFLSDPKSITEPVKIKSISAFCNGTNDNLDFQKTRVVYAIPQNTTWLINLHQKISKIFTEADIANDGNEKYGIYQDFTKFGGHVTFMNQKSGKAVDLSGLFEKDWFREMDFGEFDVEEIKLVKRRVQVINSVRPEMNEPSKTRSKLFDETGKLLKRKSQNCGAPRETVIDFLETALQEAESDKLDELSKSQQYMYLIKLIINKRDIENGAGERDLSFWMLIHLYKKSKLWQEVVGTILLEEFIKFGSLNDYNKLSCIISEDLKALPKGKKHREEAASLKSFKNLIIENFAKALQTEKSKLAASKWAPRIGKSTDRISNLGRDLAKKLYPSNIQKSDSKATKNKKLNYTFTKYRQLCSSNNKAIEVKMCNNDWKGVENDLSKVPGKAMSKYRHAFLDEIIHGEKKGERRHPDDGDRSSLRDKLLENVKKIKEDPVSAVNSKLHLIKGAKTMQPHELIKDILPDNFYGPVGGIPFKEASPVHEAQWALMVEKVRQAGSFSNTIIMSDVSGSMSGIPMEVSIALGLMVSQIQTGPWADRLMVFSTNPKWYSVPNGAETTLKEKVEVVAKMDWAYGSTNLEKCFDMILDFALENKIKNEDMPKQFMIITDMCWDQATSNNQAASNTQKLLLSIMKNKYKFHNYDFPTIILWNVRSNDITFQVSADMPGVITLGGFSINLLKSILEGKEIDVRKMSAGDMVLHGLNKKCYDGVEELLIEKCPEIFGKFVKWDFEDDRFYESSE